MIFEIKTTGNRIINNKGEKVMLRGFSIADPYRLEKKNKINPRRFINEIKELGGNIVRIPIQPNLWQIIPNFLERYIDKLVKECEQLDMYCIIDWHAIGNPIRGETRMKELFIEKNGKKYYQYESNLEITEKFWKDASKRYGKRKNVIFEIFNEPAPGEKEDTERGLSALFWRDWKKKVEEIIRIIRKNSNNLILVAPIKWAYDLSKVKEDPINEENIAYSIHPYPIHKDWEDNFEKVGEKFPLIVTEWAFKEITNTDFLRATKEDYGNLILDYMEKKGIGWVAWCYDKEWGPKILASWGKGDYTNWGEYITKKLKEFEGDKNGTRSI
jgi:aryl-phospho-beta-D-glucosidase BglC (GH1 family)